MDEATRKLARECVLEIAARDAANLAEQLERLAEGGGSDADAVNARGSALLVAESLKALDELGWS